MKKVFVALLLSLSWMEGPLLMAEEPSLEEAVGLPQGEESTGMEAISTPPSKMTTSKNSIQLKSRTYLLLDAVQQQKKDVKTYSFPNGELGFSADATMPSQSQLFFDGILSYSDADGEGRPFLNQTEFRHHWADHYQLSIGKERSRRSPGMVISPSDLLFSKNPLPGQREDRNGVWMTRFSYQNVQNSYDLIFLPVDAVEEHGLPDKDAKPLGVVLRLFQQWGPVSASFSLGSLQNHWKGGSSVEGFLATVWKFYYEVGYQEKSKDLPFIEKQKVSQHLLGMSYEGSNDASFKLEFLQNGYGLESAEFEQWNQTTGVLLRNTTATSGRTEAIPFLRQQYLMATGSLFEVFDAYNGLFSWIQSLEDDASSQIIRIENLTNDHLLIGLSILGIEGNDKSQYAYRIFDNQTRLDLKYIFKTG